MSTSISRSPALRKRPINCPVLGEWTCFKRREDLMVLLADVARINDESPLKDYFSFSMNAFIALWSQVGYLLSNSEEELIQNATKEHMRLLPYDDALEFIIQHLTRPGKLVLSIFDPKLQGKTRPTTDTIFVEPYSDEDGGEGVHASDESSDFSESSPVEGIDSKRRLRAGSKRREASLNCSPASNENRKKRKIDISDDSCPNTDKMFMESVVAFTKTFLGKKQFEKDRILKQLEEEKQARKSAEERINELQVLFKQQLEEEKEIRKTTEETVKALQDELQITNKKRQALEDKLQGIKQFLQVGADKAINILS